MEPLGRKKDIAMEKETVMIGKKGGERIEKNEREEEQKISQGEKRKRAPNVLQVLSTVQHFKVFNMVFIKQHTYINMKPTAYLAAGDSRV